MLRSDGTAWTQQTAQGMPVDFEFRGLSGIPGFSTEVVAGGCSATSGPLVWHFNGEIWEILGNFPHPTVGCIRGFSEGYFGLIVGNENDRRGRIWPPTVHNQIVQEWAGDPHTGQTYPLAATAESGLPFFLPPST